MTGGRTIAGQYGSSTGQKQQFFGPVDPFCLFAVVPMLVVAGSFIWGGIAIAGVVLIILTLLIILVDSWTNRPIKRSAAPPPREPLRAPTQAPRTAPPAPRARGGVSQQVSGPAPRRSRPAGR